MIMDVVITVMCDKCGNYLKKIFVIEKPHDIEIGFRRIRTIETQARYRCEKCKYDILLKIVS